MESDKTALQNSTLETDRPSEIDQLRKQNSDLIKRLSSVEAVKAAQRPTTKLGIGIQDAARTRAVESVGGPAFFYSLGLDQRLAALGIGPASKQDLEDARRFFGRDSIANEAAALAKQSPELYLRLRAIARELQLI